MMPVITPDTMQGNIKPAVRPIATDAVNPGNILPSMGARTEYLSIEDFEKARGAMHGARRKLEEAKQDGSNKRIAVYLLVFAVGFLFLVVYYAYRWSRFAATSKPADAPVPEEKLKKCKTAEQQSSTL